MILIATLATTEVSVGAVAKADQKIRHITLNYLICNNSAFTKIIRINPESKALQKRDNNHLASKSKVKMVIKTCLSFIEFKPIVWQIFNKHKRKANVFS